jgi:polar amino acid transport system permease protein
MTLAADSVSELAPPPLARPWTRQRKVGYALVALWIAAGIGLLLYLVLNWDPKIIERWAPAYLSGLWKTILLVVISIILGAVLSFPLTYARMSRNGILSGLAYAYVYFFRGTPLLAQTFLIYYGLGSFRTELQAIYLWDFFKDAWNCAIFAFALNTAAYQAEILRGAIASVPKGQWEGAASVGLHKVQTLWKVILPQAMITALRPYGNEIILMVKGSAVVALITVLDLMGETRLAYSKSYDFQAYIYAGFIYLALVEVLRNAVEWIERRITKHLRR